MVELDKVVGINTELLLFPLHDAQLNKNLFCISSSHSVLINFVQDLWKDDWHRPQLMTTVADTNLLLHEWQVELGLDERKI